MNTVQQIYKKYLHPEKTSKILLVCTLCISLALLSISSMFWTIEKYDQARKIKEMRESAYALTIENEELKDKTEGKNTVEWVRRIAKTEFGLVDPDTIIFTMAKGGKSNT